MNEAELADHYYANRDDLAGEEVQSRTPERMDIMISARFSMTEAAEVRAAAARVGMSVSAFIRQCALVAAAGNVIDLERVRADLRAVHSRAEDALLALSDQRAEPEPGRLPRADPAALRTANG
jgi:uncharacterized protein (DUF1778 family)